MSMPGLATGMGLLSPVLVEKGSVGVPNAVESIAPQPVAATRTLNIKSGQYSAHKTTMLFL